MNVLMVIYERCEDEQRFFIQLRAQGIPLFVTRETYRMNKHAYVSSKYLIELLDYEVEFDDDDDSVGRAFFVRERDVTLVMMLSQYRVEVLPMGGERP